MNELIIEAERTACQRLLTIAFGSFRQDHPYMKSFSPKRIVRQALLIILLFTGGILFHRYKPFPYPQVSAFAKEVAKRIARRNTRPKEVISEQYVLDPGEAELRKDIDTALLPLKITGVRLSESFKFPKGAGGITVVNDSIVIIDRLGGLYAFRNGTVSKREFPALPNHIDAFIRHSDFALEPWTLRVHDIEYIASDKVLAVAYENFDEPSQGTQLAVSIIKIDDRNLEPAGQWKTIFLGDLLSNVPTYQGLNGGGRLAYKSPDTSVSQRRRLQPR